MAGKRKAEGIALLSMYNDDEEEEEDDDGGEEEQEEEGKEEEEAEADDDHAEHHNMDVDKLHDENPTVHERAAEAQEGVAQEQGHLPSPYGSILTLSPAVAAASPVLVPALVPEDDQLSASPQPAAGASHFPLTQQMMDSGTTRSVGLGIVDYAQDDVNMSPEPEEGEITTTGRAIVVLESRVETNESHKEVQFDSSLDFVSEEVSSPKPDDLHEDSIFANVVEGNTAQASREPIREENGSTTLEAKLIDPLLEFLPPPPLTICSEELQMKFTKFLQMKNQGRSFNKDLRNSKGYRNPDFLQRAVRYQEIDQLGSCFKKEIFDPYGYDPGDFYDALVAQQRREIEKKEQERKQSQRVDFVRGGVQTAQVLAADARTKPVAPIVAPQKSGVSSNSSTAVLSTSSTDAPSIADVRVSKKSKWDKVEVNGKPLPTVPSGAQHAIAAASAHVALMSAAGAGYASFAQQKRREAEVKMKSAAKLSGFSGKSDKKFDKS